MTNFNAAATDIMNRFNFNRVYKTMQALDWRWATSHNQPPSIQELKSTAQMLLDGCMQAWQEQGEPQSGMFYATGGFEARITCYSQGEPQLSLTFSVESCRGYA